MVTTQLFRALWPIHDDSTLPWAQMLTQATNELPDVAARARVTLTGPPRFYIAPASRVPGSGNLTQFVLVADAPAAPTQTREYDLRLGRTS